jgi:AraC-like DNA-binding protein
MYIENLQEKDIYTEEFPFRLELNQTDDFIFPAHWHHAAEIVYPINGNYAALVNGQEYSMKERDILFIPGGEIHNFDTHVKGNRYFIQFEIATLDVFGHLNKLTPLLSITKLISPDNDELLHHQLEDELIKLINEYNQKTPSYILALNARIFDILVFLSRNLIDKAAAASAQNETKKLYSSQKLTSALQYIEEHYQNDISLKDVSAAAGFSQYYFSRIFKEMTEQSLPQYLNERRIKKAEKLLTTHNISILETAHATGFNSLATFNRAFKKIKGCTPMDYKRLQLK